MEHTETSFLSQSQFAKLCGVSRATVNYYLKHDIVRTVEIKQDFFRRMIPLSEVARFKPNIDRKRQAKMRGLNKEKAPA